MSHLGEVETEASILQNNAFSLVSVSRTGCLPLNINTHLETMVTKPLRNLIKYIIFHFKFSSRLVGFGYTMFVRKFALWRMVFLLKLLYSENAEYYINLIDSSQLETYTLFLYKIGCHCKSLPQNNFSCN